VTPEIFASCIRKEIVDFGLEKYIDFFKKGTFEYGETDESWESVLRIYNALDEEGKQFFVRFMRYIMRDTISSVLSIIDGSSLLSKDYDEEFKLTYGQNQNDLTGYLKDHFMAQEEDAGYK
jgi:hypothetical protein